MRTTLTVCHIKCLAHMSSVTLIIFFQVSRDPSGSVYHCLCSGYV